MPRNFIDIGFKTLLVVAVVVLYVFHYESQRSLVFVDAQRIVAGYKGAKAARRELEEKSAVWKANLDTLRGELEGKIKEYDQRKAKMTAKEKQLTEELIRTKQDQFINYQQAIQDKARQEDQELSQKVLDKVNDYIKRYGTRNGYKIILAATQYGNIAYAQDGIDVTDEVLKGLNAE